MLKIEYPYRIMRIFLVCQMFYFKNYLFECYIVLLLMLIVLTLKDILTQKSLIQGKVHLLILSYY